MNTVAEIRRHRFTEVQTLLEQRVTEFAKVLPKQIPPERFVRVMLTAIQNNADLLECERLSLFNSAMRCATDGLIPDGREAAFVVFKDKRRGKIAGYIPMIAGIRKKIRQSGEVATFEAQVVHENDEFAYELGDEPFIKHRPVLGGDRGNIIAAYSVATMRTGEKSREVMSIDEIHEVRSRSRAESGPWVTDFSEMCRKTVAKRHAKVLPTSNDLEQLFARDHEADEEAEPPAAPERPPLRSLDAKLDHLAGPEFEETESHADGEDAEPDRGKA